MSIRKKVKLKNTTIKDSSRSIAIFSVVLVLSHTDFLISLNNFGIYGSTTALIV